MRGPTLAWAICCRATPCVLVCVLFLVGATACGGPPVAPSSLTPAASVAGVRLEASPQTALLTGSTIALSARVIDEHGRGVPQATVRFATTQGTLSVTEAKTYESGWASVSLATTGAATATAVAGSSSAQLTVAVLAPFSMVVAVAPAASAYVDDTPLWVRIVPTTGVVFAPLDAAISLQCGSRSALPVGSVAGNISATISSTCAFDATGVQTVTAHARGPNGWTTSQSLAVTVLARPVTAPPPTAPPSNDQRDPYFQITALRVSAAGSVPMRWTLGLNTSHTIDRADWIFGDSTPDAINGGRVVNHTYDTFGSYEVRVNALDDKGERHQSSLRVFVTSSTTP